MALKCTTGQGVKGSQGYCGASSALNNISCCGWMKVESPATGKIFKSQFGSRPIQVAISATQITFGVNVGALTDFAAQAIPSGWFHWAITQQRFAGNPTGHLYINGVDVATINAAADTAANDAPYVGLPEGTGPTVKLYDLAFWTTILTPTNVLDLATGAARPDSIGTVYNYLAFDDQTTGNVTNGDTGLTATGTGAIVFTVLAGTPTWDADFPSFGAPPAAPSDLAVTGTTVSTIALSWSDNADDETGYDIEYDTVSTFDQGPVTVEIGAADTETGSVIDLAAGTTYYIRVRATNSFGDSDWAQNVGATAQYVSVTTATLAAGGGFRNRKLDFNRNRHMGRIT